MLKFRAFRNDDPPALVEIWRGQPATRALVQPCSVSMLERYVFSKPYFDRLGLIVATDQNHIVGFIHAGFGCSQDAAALSTNVGVLGMLMVASHRDDTDQIAAQLIQAAEMYLFERGSEHVYGAGVTPHHPFYLGLYGGAQLPGVLQSDAVRLEHLKAAGYQEDAQQRIVLHRQLAGFRPIVNRHQMQVRREYLIEANLDPPTESWWDACTEGQTDRTRFVLMPRQGGPAVAAAQFWDMEPLASGWGVHAMGLVRLEIPENESADQMATLLLGESMRQLQSQGATLIETHVAADDASRLALFAQHGFQEIDRGLTLIKQLGPRERRGLPTTTGLPFITAVEEQVAPGNQ